jgi:anti-sigma-K factor RskA
MSADSYAELASLAALGALDGEERRTFEAHAGGCAACRDELAAFAGVAAALPLALPAVPPSPQVRARVLALATRPTPARPSSVGRPARLPLWLASAASVLLAVSSVVFRAQRDEARAAAEAASRRLAALEGELGQERQVRQSLEQARSEAGRFQELVAHPESRLASLAGLKDAPQARARVLFNTGSCEAVLLVAGLPKAPEGKAYEVWVIGSGAPVPAGVFQVAPDGSAVFRLPVVQETSRVRTFAVTLEPAAGTPAPTGPMMLAGTVS